MKITKVVNENSRWEGLFILEPFDRKDGPKFREALKEGRVFRILPEEEETKRFVMNKNVGMILALWKAQWNLMMIADEVNMKVLDVAKILTGSYLYPGYYEIREEDDEEEF